MSTLTLPPTEMPPGRFSPLDALRSEWIKVRSVRSTTFTLAAMVVLTVAIGVIATAASASRWAHASALEHIAFDPVRVSLAGLLLGQLAIGVLGVLVMSAEYATGTIRATLAAIPNRPLVLAAKAAVLTAVSVVVGEAVTFVSFIVGQAILAGGHTPHATLAQSAALRAVIGGGLYLAVLGLLALGLATIVRHTAGAISIFVGLLLILPLIVQALPTSVAEAVGRYLPADIGVTIMTVNPHGHSDFQHASSFAPWTGLGVLCGYAIAALVIGGSLLARRDS